MFVDQTAIFWVSKNGDYIWMQDHGGIEDFTDELHNEVEEKNPEGVGNTGVYWMNADFESPFHISDFENRIDEINVEA